MRAEWTGQGVGVTVERSSVGSGDPKPAAGTSTSSAKERKLHWLAASLAVTAYALCILSYRPFADLTYGGDDFAYAWTAYQLAGLPDGRNYKGSWAAWEKRAGQ